MKSKPERINLVFAACSLGAGYLDVFTGDYSGCIWPFSFALACLRLYELEAWVFEIQDDDGGDDGKSAQPPVPTEPADSADWWKK